MPRLSTNIAAMLVFAFLTAAPIGTRGAETQLIGQKSTADEEGMWGKTEHDPLALYTLLLTGFTGVLAVGTLLLWRSTLRSVEVAKDAAEALPILERAYLSVEPIGPFWETFGDENGKPVPGLTFRWYLKNLGRTPAEVISLEEHITLAASPPDKPDDAESHRLPIPIILASGAQYPDGSAVRGTKLWPIAPSQHQDWKAGQYYAWWFGVVTYEDIFRKVRTTRFMYRYDGPSNKWEQFGGRGLNGRS